MPVKTVIGWPIKACPAYTYTVRVEAQTNNEPPDCITVDGETCLMVWDPGTRAGRAAIEQFIDQLRQAVDHHDTEVERLLSKLVIGDDASHVRTVHTETETQCYYPFLQISNGTRCSRPEHADGHHIVVNADQEVAAAVHLPQRQARDG